MSVDLLDEAVSDLEDLPEPEGLGEDTTPEEPSRELVTVDSPQETIKEGPICPVCDEVIIRAPGARGRAPKYHPHCRPSKQTSAGRGAKAVEVDNSVGYLVDQIRKKMMIGAMLLATISPYDGFCIAIAIPDLCTQISTILEGSPKLRESLKKGSTLNAWLMFGITLVTVLLPIMANHKMIPGKWVRNVLINLPRVLHQLHKKMEEGPEKMADEMFNQLEKRMMAPPQRTEKSAA